MSDTERVLASVAETVRAFGGYREGRQNLSTEGPELELDLSEGNLIVVEVTGDVQIMPPAVPVEAEGRGIGFVLILVQDGVGGHTVTWHGDFKWEGGSPLTVVSIPGAVTQVGAMTYNDGATWLGGGSSDFA